MNSKFLILLILVGLLSVGAWYLSRQQKPPPSPIEEHLLCSSDEECVRFQQTCDDCDCGIAVNQEYRAVYQEEKSLRCKYEKIVTLCSLFCINTPKCVKNRCVMVEVDGSADYPAAERAQEDLPPALTAPLEPVETIGEPPPPPAPKGPSVEELQGAWKLEKELNLNFTTGQFEEQTSITCERNCYFLFKGNGVCFNDAPPPQGLPLLCLDEDYLPFTISGNMLSWQRSDPYDYEEYGERYKGINITTFTWEVEIKNGKLEILYPGKATYSLKRIFVKAE